MRAKNNHKKHFGELVANLTIGKLAKQAKVGIETIRFYERQGVIASPRRTESNYRIYEPEDIARLRFIKRAKELGFTLKEIKELLFLRHDSKATKDDVRRKTMEKIVQVQNKIADLSGILAALQKLTEHCDGHGPASECPILEALDGHDSHHGHK